VSQVLSDLLSIDALLSDETKWCRDVFARDKAGRAVSPYNPCARSWCLAGAIARACGGLDAGAQRHQYVINALEDVLSGSDTLIIFNDDNDFSAVKALLAEAIRRNTIEA
jgi:hypothetical protein